MGRKAEKDMQPGCCNQATNLSVSNYKVEAMVSVDERGQMVLPKELRDKAGIRPGDKLMLVNRKDGGEACCISLVKADYFMRILNERLGPVMGELAPGKQ